MPASAAATAVKMSVVLDSSGQVVGAFKPSHYRPAKEGDEGVVTVGVEAAPGQSIVEVEVSTEVANLDAHDLLSRLAEQSSVREVIANTPTASQVSWGSSQAVMAVPFGVSQQGPVGQPPRSFEIGGTGTITASLVG